MFAFWNTAILAPAAVSGKITKVYTGVDYHSLSRAHKMNRCPKIAHDNLFLRQN